MIRSAKPKRLRGGTVQAMNTSGKQKSYSRKWIMVVARKQKTRNKFRVTTRGRILVVKRVVGSGAAFLAEQWDETQILKALLCISWCHIYISKTYHSDKCRQIFNADGKKPMSSLKDIHIWSIHPNSQSLLKRDHWGIFLVLTNNYWMFSSSCSQASQSAFD